jgi:hypothetical protein
MTRSASCALSHIFGYLTGCDILCDMRHTTQLAPAPSHLSLSTRVCGTSLLCSTMSRTETELSASQYQRQWSSLIGAALESWTHQLLFMRHVYPRETFTTVTFLGIRSHMSRHPDVVNYITNVCRVAVPAILSGAADEITLSIFDHDESTNHTGTSDAAAIAADQCNRDVTCCREIEAYILRFTDIMIPSVAANDQNEESASATTVPLEALQNLERGIRDLVLSAHALDKETAAVRSDSTSFKLILHISQKDKSCASLNEAFANGTWFTAATAANDGTDSSPKVIRPLHHFRDVTSTGSILFAVRKGKKSNRKRPQPTKDKCDDAGTA